MLFVYLVLVEYRITEHYSAVEQSSVVHINLYTCVAFDPLAFGQMYAKFAPVNVYTAHTVQQCTRTQLCNRFSTLHFNQYAVINTLREFLANFCLRIDQLLCLRRCLFLFSFRCVPFGSFEDRFSERESKIHIKLFTFNWIGNQLMKNSQASQTEIWIA